MLNYSIRQPKATVRIFAGCTKSVNDFFMALQNGHTLDDYEMLQISTDAIPLKSQKLHFLGEAFEANALFFAEEPVSETTEVLLISYKRDKKNSMLMTIRTARKRVPNNLKLSQIIHSIADKEQSAFTILPSKLIVSGRMEEYIQKTY